MSVLLSRKIVLRSLDPSILSLFQSSIYFFQTQHLTVKFSSVLSQDVLIERLQISRLNIFALEPLERLLPDVYWLQVRGFLYEITFRRFLSFFLDLISSEVHNIFFVHFFEILFNDTVCFIINLKEKVLFYSITELTSFMNLNTGNRFLSLSRLLFCPGFELFLLWDPLYNPI